MRTGAALFLSHVDVVGDCWLWTASKNHKGYGHLGPTWGTRYAHIWAYETWVGRVPEGLEIDHTCKVRHCVNPDHLEAVTHQENLRRSRGQFLAAMKRKSEEYRTTVTRCSKGHEYTPENVYQHPTRGYRICRTCHKASAKSWRERRKNAHAG